MWNKIRKNIIFQHVVAATALSLLVYLVIVPLFIHVFLPQYNIVKNYSAVEVCSDLAPGTPTTVFLPISCASLGELNKLGCLYANSTYQPPAKASADEKIVCPALVRGVDSTGAKNPALAVLGLQENTLRFILTAALLVAASLIYIVVRLFLRRKMTANAKITISSD